MERIYKCYCNSKCHLKVTESYLKERTQSSSEDYLKVALKKIIL